MQLIFPNYRYIKHLYKIVFSKTLYNAKINFKS